MSTASTSSISRISLYGDHGAALKKLCKKTHRPVAEDLIAKAVEDLKVKSPTFNKAFESLLSTGSSKGDFVDLEVSQKEITLINANGEKATIATSSIKKKKERKAVQEINDRLLEKINDVYQACVKEGHKKALPSPTRERDSFTTPDRRSSLASRTTELSDAEEVESTTSHDPDSVSTYRSSRSRKKEIASLKKQAQALTEQLARIQKRLSELESETASNPSRGSRRSSLSSRDVRQIHARDRDRTLDSRRSSLSSRTSSVPPAAAKAKKPKIAVSTQTTDRSDTRCPIQMARKTALISEMKMNPLRKELERHTAALEASRRESEVHSMAFEDLRSHSVALSDVLQAERTAHTETKAQLDLVLPKVVEVMSSLEDRTNLAHFTTLMTLKEEFENAPDDIEPTKEQLNKFDTLPDCLKDEVEYVLYERVKPSPETPTLGVVPDTGLDLFIEGTSTTAPGITAINKDRGEALKITALQTLQMLYSHSTYVDKKLLMDMYLKLSDTDRAYIEFQLWMKHNKPEGDDQYGYHAFRNENGASATDIERAEAIGRLLTHIQA